MSSAKPKKIKFRCVEEGRGGTLPLSTPNGEAQHIGTYFLNTCVGVYFQVAQNRCFCAHMDARTPELWPWMVLSDEGGKDIAHQVKRRLQDFAKEHKWDLEDADFGRHLHLQSPMFTKEMIEGTYSPSPAWWMVQAISDFFESCAGIVDQKIENRRAHRPEGNHTSKTVRQYDRDTSILEQRSKNIRAICKNGEVFTTHHAFIVSPLTGKVEMFGEMVNDRQLLKSDLGENEPVNLGLKPYIYHFGVLKDDFRGVLPESKRASRLASYEHRELIRERIKMARSLYQNGIKTPEPSIASKDSGGVKVSTYLARFVKCLVN